MRFFFVPIKTHSYSLFLTQIIIQTDPFFYNNIPRRRSVAGGIPTQERGNEINIFCFDYMCEHINYSKGSIFDNGLRFIAATQLAINSSLLGTSKQFMQPF